MKISKEALSLLLAALMAFSFAACCSAAETDKALSGAEERMTALYGENKPVTDGNPLTQGREMTSKKIIDPMTLPLLMEEYVKAMRQRNEELKALYRENKKITDDNYDKSLAVKCVNGTFVGRKVEDIIEYRGIPFVGKQPVGELRWKAPVDYAADDGVYEAYTNGKTACQRPVETASVQGEDCLYLNIWKAEDAGASMRVEKKPVMVWIHGGGFEIGATYEPGYSLLNFVKENPDVIGISIAYRLGALGFLHLSHLPDGKEYPDAQNLGLLDQKQALKWIHENIAGFGGDPDNVTIFGESAGGGSVTLLPLIEGSHPYIKRVIAESGSPAMTKSPEQAISCTNAIMDELGCKTVADLLKVDAETLVKVAGDKFSMGIAPERDGIVLPSEPHDAYANGAAKDIDILIGCNKDEMNCFVSSLGEDGFIAWGGDLKEKKYAQLTEKDKALAESFCKEVKGENYEHISRLLDQYWFIAPFIRTAENQAMAGGKAYSYFFTVESSLPLMKSGHGAELPVVLNHPEANMGIMGREIDETFSKTVRKMWVQFAKTGDPSLSADISPDGKAKEWPVYDTENKWIMILDEFNIHAEKESEKKIVDWDRTYPLTKYYLY